MQFTQESILNGRPNLDARRSCRANTISGYPPKVVTGLSARRLCMAHMGFAKCLKGFRGGLQCKQMKFL